MCLCECVCLETEWGFYPDFRLFLRNRDLDGLGHAVSRGTAVRLRAIFFQVISSRPTLRADVRHGGLAAGGRLPMGRWWAGVTAAARVNGRHFEARQDGRVSRNDLVGLQVLCGGAQRRDIIINRLNEIHKRKHKLVSWPREMAWAGRFIRNRVTPSRNGCQINIPVR